MRTVAGLFEHVEDAEQAASGLYRLGFRPDQVNVLARDVAVQEKAVGKTSEALTEGAIGGTVIGGLGGLLLGLSAMSVPGIGPIITAGSIFTALGSTAAGAGVGAITGGLIGALSGAGIPEKDAHAYAEGVKQGGVLVVVKVENDALAPEVSRVMFETNAVDINVHREAARNNGVR
ncbi:MAG: hypothetical protein HC884_02780 [Chloroflexaceae bacterium]|nr:hypothetical protein [Chloroflexaceae bacterium]